ncbi:hypothetical protein IU479_27310 [Nocardia abscessus]|nr:hypothetical protein [Nocardia abscessus]
MVVRCFPQGGGEHHDFDFTQLPLAAEIQRGLAMAFASRTAPGGRVASMGTCHRLFRSCRLFAVYLAELLQPPQRLADLSAEHIDGYLLHRREKAVVSASRDLGEVKRLLRRADGLSEELRLKLRERDPHCEPSLGRASYSRVEFAQIAAAARGELRVAAARIRRNRVLLERYRAGELEDADRRLELLDYVDCHGDVPRLHNRSKPENAGPPPAWVRRHGAPVEVMIQLHLLASEAMAGVFLMAILTGQNCSVILDLEVGHHRADGHSGATGTAILDTRKPRRGRRAYMNLALSDVPDWITIPDQPEDLSARDELHTAFGVYALMIELTARSRAAAGTDQLFLCYNVSGGREIGRGLRRVDPDVLYPVWSKSHNLMSEQADEDGNPIPLHVTMDRLRLTYLELHQKPVAHRATTLVKDYLAQNRTSFSDYQKVVAAALTEEVAKTRVRAVMTRLSTQDLARARTEPDQAAEEHGLDLTIFKRMIAGELDTVMAACVDDGSGPQSADGQPCRASFMHCLECPCARALPHHLPIQTLVHDRLEARKSEMPPLAWVQRFGLAHARLADLLARHDQIDVDDARTAASDADHALVERLLNRELDLR